MNKDTFLKYLPLGVLFVILVLVMPKNSRFPYDYRQGSEWTYENLFAEFDFPIYKTDDQLREEYSASASELVPYYRFSEEVVNKNLSAADKLSLGSLRRAVLTEMRSIYSKGVMADEGRRNDAPEADVIYLQKDKRAIKTPISEVYRQTDARAKLLADLSALTSINVDSLLRDQGVYDLIVPNVIYDEVTTELVNQEQGVTVSPTSGYVTAGQLIVSEGEIVTAEVEQMLDSYKKEYEENVGYLGPPFLLWLGDIIISLALVVLLYFVISFCYPTIFKDARYPYVVVLFALSATASFIGSRFGDSVLFCIPFTLIALMLQAFMKPKGVAVFYTISLVPLLVCSENGPVLFIMFLTAGIFSAYIFHYFQRGWKQFINALITFAILSVLFLGFRAADLVVGHVGYHLFYLFIASFLTVAGYPLVYLFEKVFNLVSKSRLAEFCDTSAPIIRELEKKAPGTFQHSLQVMNMAEAVARAVDVNPDLVRAGALYHDIGKMENPQCFVENEYNLKPGEQHRYHAELTPMQSAHDIIKHVSDGMEIAARNRIPKIVSEFILTHHGTTTVKFFLNKYLNAGGDPAYTDEFRYKGEKPHSKEQIILMLCDSCEAASRTLNSNTAEAYSAFVESIVAGKMEEGQFDDAEISISELNKVKEALKTYLAQLNHERIAYPKRKKINNK